MGSVLGKHRLLNSQDGYQAENAYVFDNLSPIHPLLPMNKYVSILPEYDAINVPGFDVNKFVRILSLCEN